MSTSTDEKKIEELLTRGVANIFPKREFLYAQLKSGKRLTIYTGYDPTAPTLHIGHGITLLKLRQFQELGHKIVMLIGDFTGMIGDPTDKLATRKQLTRKEVLQNCALYKKQASAILRFTGKNPAQLKYNSTWLKKMNFSDILEVAAHLTVPQLLERDMFQERLKSGGTIHLHEFLYPLMQGYDSVAMNVDGEVGGNDQTFNMLVGRDLMKELKQKEKFVVALQLLTDNAGKKMSKTEGNMIAFADSGEEMFGKVMRWSDDMIERGFELCTMVPIPEIRQMGDELRAGKNPRDAKLLLAFEVTKTFLGEKAATAGKNRFATVIQHHEAPTEMTNLHPSAFDIVTVLVEAGFARSRSDARRAVEQGGVSVNDEKVVSIECVVKVNDVVKKGKRFYVRIA